MMKGGPKRGKSTLAYNTRALLHVRLKSEQATEALWSSVISMEKSGTAEWT